MNLDKVCALFCGLHWHGRFIYESGQKSIYKCADPSCDFHKHQSLDPLENPDFSPRSPDWWTLWERVTKDKKFLTEFGHWTANIWYGLMNNEKHAIWFVNNLRENVCEYLKHAMENGIHPELFKQECEKIRLCDSYMEECCRGCNGTGYIDTPLARALKEV